MEEYFVDNGKMTKEMDMELERIKMEIDGMDNLKIINLTEKVFIFGKIIKNIKEIMLMENEVGKALLIIRMGVFIMVNG
jgi:hypothetical protein